MSDKPIDEIIEKLRMYCSMTGRKPDGTEGVDYKIISDAKVMVEVPEIEALLDEVERLRNESHALRGEVEQLMSCDGEHLIVRRDEMASLRADVEQAFESGRNKIDALCSERDRYREALERIKARATHIDCCTVAIEALEGDDE